MSVSLSSKIFTIMAAGLLILIMVSVASIFTLRRYDQAAHTRAVTFEVTTLLERLMSELKFAESGQRGFLLTQDPHHMNVYKRAIKAAPLTLAEIKRTALDDDVKTQLDLLDQPIKEKLAELAETLSLWQSGEEEESLAVVRTGRGVAFMMEIRGIIDSVKLKEEVLLQQRNDALQVAKNLNYLCLFGAIAFAVILKAGALYVIHKEIKERKEAQLIAIEANEKSQQQLQAITMLSRLTTMLHSCNTQEEASQAIAQFGPRIFGSTSGAVYTYNSSRDLVEALVTWGGGVESQEYFSPDSCWGLRTGQDYPPSNNQQSLRCAHMQQQDKAYKCIPMLAQGEAIGLFHIEGFDDASPDEKEYLATLASTTADVIAPALVNLRLRESLRQQSIRDPLTGLYNRRFMEESFKREIGGAERRNSSVAAIMIDLDHFKKLNDTYGHEGGDAVLQAVGRALMNNTRPEDICCRYGGEELAIILPGTDLTEATKRAEHIREIIEGLRVKLDGSELKVTASLGVAVYPAHGVIADQIVRTADHALYQAKAEGRNRVWAAPATKS